MTRRLAGLAAFGGGPSSLLRRSSVQAAPRPSVRGAPPKPPRASLSPPIRVFPPRCVPPTPPCASPKPSHTRPPGLLRLRPGSGRGAGGTGQIQLDPAGGREQGLQELLHDGVQGASAGVRGDVDS